MLGRTLCPVLAGHEVIIFDLPEGDITNGDAVQDFFDAQRPDCVVHTAAMTAVDDCETNADEAMRVNGEGSANVAAAAARVGARLIAISTDYVFDGLLDRPCHEDDTPAPRTVYGRSKLAGEAAIRRLCPGFTDRGGRALSTPCCAWDGRTARRCGLSTTRWAILHQPMP